MARQPLIHRLICYSDKAVLHLDNGASGEVWSVRSERTSALYAMKIMHIPGPHPGASRAQQFQRLLTDSNAPNCTKQYVLSPKIKFTSQEFTWHVSLFVTLFSVTAHIGRQCLLYELHGISLERLSRKRDLFPLPPDQFRAILWQMFRAADCKSRLGQMDSSTSIYPAHRQSCMGLE